MVSVSAFLRDAAALFEAASRGGGDDSQYSILIGTDGGIHLVSGSDWALESLRQHHGAQAAYRITRAAGRVALDGRSCGGSCRLESGPLPPMTANWRGDRLVDALRTLDHASESSSNWSIRK